MSKNVVRKANKTIIAKILDEIRFKIETAAFYRELNESDKVSYNLHMVWEYRQTAFNMYQFGVFNRAEHDFFTTEYIICLINHGFKSQDVWNNKNEKE